MPRKQNVHVTHNKGDLLFPWDVKYAKDLIASYSTKKAAVDSGRTLARQKKTELVIHGRNGKIQRKHSYGNDPRSIRG